MLGQVDTLYAFDDGSVPDLMTDEDRLSPHDPGRPLVGLHAKVFAFEDEGRRRSMERALRHGGASKISGHPNPVN